MILILILSLTILGSIGQAQDLPKERQLPRLVDQAGLLSSREGQKIEEKLDDISERQKLDVVIVTTNSLDGLSGREYADDFFDYNGYGMGVSHDGILLLISMEDRDAIISTTGYGITAFTDAGQDYIWDLILDDFGKGNFEKGFIKFADLSDDFISQARKDKPYDRRNLPKKPASLILIPISLGIGALIAFGITWLMRAQLKTVAPVDSASSYVRDNSMNLQASRELFLYSTIHRKARPKEDKSSSGSSSHRSSSGRSHGGSSRKF